MQDQGKRLLMAVALALGVMLVWQLLFPSKKEDKPKPTTAGQTVPSVPKTPVGLGADGKPLPPAQRGEEKTIKLVFPNVDMTFSSYGGVLKSWHLTDHRYDRDATRGELLPAKPDTGVFGVNFANSTYVLPPNAEWTGTKVSDTQVKYTIVTDQLDVEKVFVIDPKTYVIKLTVKVRVKVPAGQVATETLAMTMYGFQDPKVKSTSKGFLGGGIAPRVWESATLRGNEVIGTKLQSVQAKPRYEANFKWTGFEHPFLLVAIAPKPDVGMTVEKTTVAEGDEGLMRTDIVFKPVAIFKSDRDVMVREIAAYLGPKHYNALQAADDIAGFTTGFHSTIDLGWFGFIGKPLMWLLLLFQGFVKNWGIAIVLLTILVKGLTIPFTTKSMRSMKAMAVLAPQLKELQEKYKDDKQRIQMETMALYKQEGANPLSGCLPIFLQMPIWLALYRMLSNTGELYQQAFIPGWIDDLTYSDPYYILPIILMVTMFVQARMQPMSPDPSQKMQQRMMQYGLPLMFGVMSFVFPAGLTLYIFTNTILSALHSIYMNKFDKKSIELARKIKERQEARAQAANKTAANKAKDANTSKSDEDDDDEADGAPPAPIAKIAPRNQPPRKRKKRRR